MRTPPRTGRSTPAAARLTRLAGWSLIVIAVLHVAVFVPQVPWGEWVDGGLRAADPDPESVAVFWALPGGIVLPAVLTGWLMLRSGRLGRRVPLAFAFVLIGWVVFCVWLIGPSGFLAVLATAGLVIAAAIADRSESSPHARSA